MVRYNKCPDCYSERIGVSLVENRLNQQYCEDCDWHGEIYEPEVKIIKNKRKILVGNFLGFNYEVFDKYGQIVTSSRFYSDKQEAKDKLISELVYLNNRDKKFGPYTGLLWPDYVEVEAESF